MYAEAFVRESSFSFFPSFSSTLPSPITNVSKYWHQRIGLQGNCVPFWFRVLVRSGFPFGRGNSEGRTLSPNGPVAFLCYSDAESWSRWYVYSLMGIVVGGHEFTLYGPPVERNSCHNHNSTFSFSAISGRRGSFPEWSFISYPSLTPSYCHTLPQHRAFVYTR